METDSEQSRPSESGFSYTGLKNTTFVYSGPDEKLIMNKYQLLLALERLLKKPKGPHLEHVGIPFALFLALLLALLPTDFQEYWSLGPEVWEAIAIILTVGSGIATIGMFFWWLRNIRNTPKQTADGCYDEILEQMSKDAENIERIERARIKPTQEPSKEDSRN